MEKLVLRTEDDFFLVADLHVPETKPWAIAYLGHAMMVDRRTLDRPRGRGLASTLVERGVVVVNVDFRGHGESTRPRAPSFTFDDIVRYDVPAWLRAARERFPDLPRFLVGHSLGVNAGLPGAARMPDHDLAGAIGLAPNLWLKRFEPNPVRLAQKELMVRAFDLASRPTGFFDPDLVGMGKSKIPRAYVRQFRRFWDGGRLVSEDGKDDYEALLGTLRIPILAVSGRRDLLMAHPDVVERYLSLFRSAEVEHLRVRGGRGFDPDHMGLVIAPEARPLFERCADFLAEVVARRSSR